MATPVSDSPLISALLQWETAVEEVLVENYEERVMPLITLATARDIMKQVYEPS